MNIEDIKVPAVVYPRYLGVDAAGDDVYELSNGRWTWGENPYEARCNSRSFEPARYIEKYGRPIGLPDEAVDRKAESDLDPDEVAALYLAARQTVDGKDRTKGANEALTMVLDALGKRLAVKWKGHEAAGHPGEFRGQKCSVALTVDDILATVNEVAEGLGIAAFSWRDVA